MLILILRTPEPNQTSGPTLAPFATHCTHPSLIGYVSFYKVQSKQRARCTQYLHKYTFARREVAEIFCSRAGTMKRFKGIQIQRRYA